MKVLLSIAVFAVAAIGGVVGQLGHVQWLDRQDGCNTALDAVKAINNGVQGCGSPDAVILMSLMSFTHPATGGP